MGIVFRQFDGRGFNTEILKTATGIGLNNIATRIKFLKGEHHIQSKPGKGTEINFKIPL